jgi:hypothetical protein
MNICDYIKRNNIPHEVLPDGRIKQVGNVRIISKGITSLDGFVQNGHLDLVGNKITSLKGFVQNGVLDLAGNEITSLEGFTQTDRLYLEYNNIYDIDDFSMKNGTTINLKGNRIYKQCIILNDTLILYVVIYSKGKFYIYNKNLIHFYTENLRGIYLNDEYL